MSQKAPNGDQTIELFKLYKSQSIYQRELRPYKERWVGRVHLRSPQTDLIKPSKDYQIYGGRTGFLDRKQGTFGYFYGGGWVYGIVENTRFRAEPGGIDEYKQNHDLTPVFRAGRVKGKRLKTVNWRPGVRLPRRVKKGRYLEVVVDREAFETPGKLPEFKYLRHIDTLAVAHDYGLRVLDAKAWQNPSYASSKDYERDKEAVNRELREALIEYRDVDFPLVKEDWVKAKRHMRTEDWEAFGSLIYYEKALVNSAIFYLSFADGVDGFGARVHQLSQDYQKSRLYSYSPPAVQLSSKTLCKVVSDTGEVFLTRPTDDERSMSNLMHEYYVMEQKRLEQEYLREFKNKD